MQVVHGLDLGQLHEVLPDLLDVDVLGRRLQQDAQAGRKSATAALSISSTTTSDAMASARSKPQTTITTPAISVPPNP